MYATLAWFQEKWGWQWEEKSLRYSYKNWHVTQGAVENPTDVFSPPDDDMEMPVETIMPTPVGEAPAATDEPILHDELKIRRSEREHDELRRFEA